MRRVRIVAGVPRFLCHPDSLSDSHNGAKLGSSILHLIFNQHFAFIAIRCLGSFLPFFVQ